MTEKRIEKYRNQLRAIAARVHADAAVLEEDTRVATGGTTAGNLSSAPMHLADLGTELYLQELNSTLLENEGHIRDEVIAALRRLDAGTYGVCENCGQNIKAARLEVIPYTRYCTACAEELESGAAVNFNAGRPQSETETISARDAADEREGFAGSEDQIPLTDLEAERDHGTPADIHAAGTPGGGTAVGGLAGTTIGGGDPADADLENAMGSGNFDVALEGDQEELDAYAGPTGGAVGGTPAGKRSRGGKKPR